MAKGKPRDCSCTAILICLLAAAVIVPIHGYWYSTSTINKYIQRCGAYPTLDKAIAEDMRHNGFEPAWFEEYIKRQSARGVPFTWYVVPKVKAEYRAAYDQAPKPAAEQWCGGSFYHHTRAGWVGMPEHLGNASGYLDLWMRAYRLYGIEGG